MSDLIGVVGTIIGIIRLGILVCENLYLYYEAYKSFNLYIIRIISRIDGLK
jgi:hypothetical protein